MEMRARCDRVRIAESECRRQQLEAYLQRKGKLKVPGPTDRYYLGDKTNQKIQQRTAPFKAGLGGDQKHDAQTKQSKLKGAKNLTCTNHAKSMVARSQVQCDSKTTEKNPTLTKQITTALLPEESNAEKESIADATAQSRQHVRDLNPEASTCNEINHKSSYQEKENKRTVSTARITGQSTGTALIKRFPLQANNTQAGRLKKTASDNQSWAVGIDDMSRAAPGAARPVGASRAAPGAARPVGASRAAPGAARPVGASRAAPGAARPVGASRAAPGAARPVGASRAAPGAARPVGASRAAPGAARPVGASRPVVTTRAAPGAAKAPSAAAKSTGGMTNPKEPLKEKMEKNCRKLNKREQQFTGHKTGKSPCGASVQNGSNSAASRSVTIWKPFTRSAQKLHPALGSPTTKIKKSKGAVQNMSESTAPVMSTVKCRDDQSSITKTLKGKDERRKQLEEWLISKGKTYKRPPMPTPFKKVLKSVKKNLEHSFLEAMEGEEQKDLSDRVQHMLDDCMKLLERGSSPEQVSEALQNVPEGEKFAKYWICQARLLELTDSMEAVIALFEQAVHNGAEPVEELRSALVETIMRNANSRTACTEKDDVKTEGFEESAVATPCTKVVRLLCGKTDGHGSSVIKYRVTATPQVLRTNELQSRIRSTGQQDLKLLTPVRRSVRIEHVSASYPKMLREHDCCVASLNELLAEEEAETFVYRENRALLGE
ncbi:cytoskeleton-associated protein 2-like isoform X2 [Pristis pectinata]|uniref:cytoskeleton-associated protein 2-like isoform X2 n=1 Tax=Pristis pectinata TaxID=685728 RepID=UPI00223DC384|nr:cytoskeleton-associated protein 2-like isoform X2 [Pristis pectinata]